MNDSLN